MRQTKKRPAGMKRVMHRADVERFETKMPVVERALGGVGSGDSLEVYLPDSYVWIDLGKGTYFVGRYAK